MRASMARYTDEEVDEILRRAIRRQQKAASGLAHDDLVAAAREIGIEAADVEAAVAEMRAGTPLPAVRASVPALTEDDDDDALERKDRSSRRARFVRHLATYVIVNAALVGMNLMTGGYPWVLWVILGWGIGVALQGAGLLLPEDPHRRERKRKQLRRRRDKESQRERARLEAQSRKEARRRSGKDFERAVQEGVGLLLGAAARKLDEVVREKDHDGDRFRVAPDDDRVRVELDRQDDDHDDRDEDDRDERKHRRKY